MCNDIGTTREHVPPRSLFPRKRSLKLVVVPSCPKHNNGHSADVEYVRNVIVSAWVARGSARSLLEPSVVRSFDRSPKLMSQTFEELIPVFANGQETVAFGLDMSRFNRVLSAIAYGIHYYHFERKYFGSWKVVCTDLVSINRDPEKRRHSHSIQADRRRLLSSLPYVPTNFEHPEIFEAQIADRTQHELVIKMRFFEGLTVFAVGIPFYRVRTT